MIGVLLFAALVIADIVCYFIDSDEADSVMLFGRPVVAFLGARSCDGSFGESLAWAAAWGIIGFLISIYLSENKTNRSDPALPEKVKLPSEDKPVGEDKPGTENGSDEVTAVPMPPDKPVGPVYRDDIFEISDTRLTRCREYHEYIRIPPGVTVIRKDAFWTHTHLRRVIFPDTLKTIEEGAFFNCVLLEEVVLPEGVETIGKDAFRHCRSLKKIHFPKSLKSIAEGAFTACTELSAVSFADGCAADVEHSAFHSCRKLWDFTIPGTVNVIGTKLFPFFDERNKKTIVRCHAGSSAYFEARRADFTCVLLDGKEYDATGDFLIEDGVLKSYTGKNYEVLIPKGVKSIKDDAFRSSKHITRVVIPDSVTTIGAGAFDFCTDLCRVELPGGLQCIPSRAFCRCSRLTEIVMPQGLTTIGQSAFEGTGLGEVRLPDGLKTIQQTAFGFCRQLHTIHIPASVQSMEDCLEHSKHAVIVAEPGSKAAQYAARKAIPLRAPGSDPRQRRAPRSEELPGNIRRTYYETLSTENKLAYSLLVQPLLQMESQCDLSGIPLQKVNQTIVWEALEADYPELFWVNWNTLRNDHLDKAYTITKDQRDQAQRQIDALVKPFLASIPQDLSEYEKAKRVYEWVADKLEYDDAGLEAQKNNQYDSVTADDLRNIYGAFVKKKVVCTGYAMAYVYLLHALGIECVMRSGGGKLGAMHAWACAKLEGDYYHIDVTSGDGEDLNYAYFGLTDDEMYSHQRSLDSLKDHISCNATRCCYYAKEGLYPEYVNAEDLLRRIRNYHAEHRYTTTIKIKFRNKLLLHQAQDCLEEDRCLDALARELGSYGAGMYMDYVHNLLEIRFR